MNPQNELIKRKFYEWLREAEGRTDATIDKYLRTIKYFEINTGYIEFRKLDIETIIKFKEKVRDTNLKANSPVTIRSYLIYLQKFFMWLVEQKGYENLRSKNLVSYLSPNLKENTIASTSKVMDIPTLMYVKQLCKSIKGEDAHSKRDQAMIALAFISPLRIDSIISMNIKCFNPITKVIDLNPLNNVRTKFSKHLRSHLFDFDIELTEIVLNWYRYLLSIGFNENDPLFPKTNIEISKDSLSFTKGLELVKAFWSDTGSARNIFLKRARQANLKVYSPHKYRHGCFNHILPFIKSGDQLKALSQTFGHESIKTSLEHYGDQPPKKDPLFS